MEGNKKQSIAILIIVYINILTKLKSSVFPESQRPNNSTVSPDFLLLIITSNITKIKLDVHLKTVSLHLRFKIPTKFKFRSN